MSACEHTWSYKFGQGRWYQCSTCKQWGDRFMPGGPSGEIVPQTCDQEGCQESATKLKFVGMGTELRCAVHRNA